MLRGLVKIAELDVGEETKEDRADRRLRKYRSIQESKPDARQVLTYSGIGAGLGLTGTVLENAVKAKSRHELFGEHNPGSKGSTRRAIAGRVLGAATTVGLAPIMRHWADRKASEAELRKSLEELQQPKLSSAILHGVLDKLAFETSQFSGPLSMGRFPMVSGMPDGGAASELLRTTNAKFRDKNMPKLAVSYAWVAEHSKAGLENASVERLKRIADRTSERVDKLNKTLKLDDDGHRRMSNNNMLEHMADKVLRNKHGVVHIPDRYKEHESFMHKNKKALVAGAIAVPALAGLAYGVHRLSKKPLYQPLVDAEKLLEQESKEAAPTTIGGWAQHAKSIGNVRSSPLPGRSIADQIKPRGKGFGYELPGAMKGGLG